MKTAVLISWILCAEGWSAQLNVGQTLTRSCLSCCSHPTCKKKLVNWTEVAFICLLAIRTPKSTQTVNVSMDIPVSWTSDVLPHWSHWREALLCASPPGCIPETTCRWPGHTAFPTGLQEIGKTCFGCTDRSGKQDGNGEKSLITFTAFWCFSSFFFKDCKARMMSLCTQHGTKFNSFLGNTKVCPRISKTPRLTDPPQEDLRLLKFTMLEVRVHGSRETQLKAANRREAITERQASHTGTSGFKSVDGIKMEDPPEGGEKRLCESSGAAWWEGGG